MRGFIQSPLSNYFTLLSLSMRIFLVTIVILLGANLLVDLVDSDLRSIIEERNESINKLR
jgi:hypothetical protein